MGNRRNRNRQAPENPSFYEALGRAIKVLRTARGLERKELAEASGVSYPYLSEIENGTKHPSSETLFAIAEALGVRPHELLASAETWNAPSLGDSQVRSPAAMPAAPAHSRWFGAMIEAMPRDRRETDEPRSAPQRRAREALIRELPRLTEQLSDEDLARLVDLARRLLG